MGWLTWAGAVLVSLAVVATAAAAYGSARWTQGTRALRAGLEAARLPANVTRYDAREIEGLPAPVQRYFRAVLTDGQAVVTAVTVEHSGTFNMSAAGQQWKPFTSNQQGRFWGHEVRGGMLVPLQGEAAWLLPEGVQPYWRGTSTALAHEFAPLH
jgi:hypothetical protein